jgi:hypothetical protein
MRQGANGSEMSLNALLPLSMAVLLNGMLTWQLIAPDVLDGRRIPVTATMVIALHVVAIIRRPPSLTRPLAALSMALLGQAGVLALSLLNSGSTSYGMWKFGAFLALSVAPCLACLWCYRGDLVSIRRLLIALAALAVVPAAVVVSEGIQSEIAQLPWAMKKAGWDVIGISRAMGVGAVALLGLAASSPSARVPMIVIGSGFVALEAAVAERGPLLATTVALSYVLWHSLRSRGGRFDVAASAAVWLVFVLCAGMMLLAFVPRLTWSELASDGRVDIARVGLELFVDHPMAGGGLGSLAYAGSDSTSRQYFHNVIGELATETGLIGLAVCLLWFMMLWRYSRREAAAVLAPEHTASRAVFVFAFLAAQVSGDLATNYMVWVAAGLCYCTSLAKRHPADTTLRPVEQVAV